MKIIMQTRGVMERFRTHFLFDEEWEDLKVVCHTHRQADKIAEVLPGVPVFVHGLPEGITAIGPVRDWIEKELIKPGEWYVGIDDNINTFFKVKKELYDLPRVEPELALRSNFRELIRGREQINATIDELIAQCEKQGTIYGGFGWMENPLFRRIKWQRYGYAKAKFYVKKNVGLKWCWDPRIKVMYDHAQSFKVIDDYGSVAVNRFVYVEHPQYEAGGIGSHAERMPYRTPTLDFLYEYFDGFLYCVNGDYDKPLARLKTEKTVQLWRASRRVPEMIL